VGDERIIGTHTRDPHLGKVMIFEANIDGQARLTTPSLLSPLRQSWATVETTALPPIRMNPQCPNEASLVLDTVSISMTSARPGALKIACIVVSHGSLLRLSSME
jgi:hypothetical protein